MLNSSFFIEIPEWETVFLPQNTLLSRCEISPQKQKINLFVHENMWGKIRHRNNFRANFYPEGYLNLLECMSVALRKVNDSYLVPGKEEHLICSLHSSHYTNNVLDVSDVRAYHPSRDGVPREQYHFHIEFSILSFSAVRTFLKALEEASVINKNEMELICSKFPPYEKDILAKSTCHFVASRHLPFVPQISDVSKMKYEIGKANTVYTKELFEKHHIKVRQIPMPELAEQYLEQMQKYEGRS